MNQVRGAETRREGARRHLDAALAASTDQKTRYHIRQALQMLQEA